MAFATSGTLYTHTYVRPYIMHGQPIRAIYSTVALWYIYIVNNKQINTLYVRSITYFMFGCKFCNVLIGRACTCILRFSLCCNLLFHKLKHGISILSVVDRHHITMSLESFLSLFTVAVRCDQTQEITTENTAKISLICGYIVSYRITRECGRIDKYFKSHICMHAE